MASSGKGAEDSSSDTEYLLNALAQTIQPASGPPIAPDRARTLAVRASSAPRPL
ncbi:hypothetical protein PsYK624_134560 [Phanerochaete sordida]|uniref:Uncharacterized protein n=1 Tax=Phanerochaete sordida TaxID=48140 RepID=A0A9P3LJ69_9APHY|nr:hypothetical protein PsYK624_134560 [Phanerochaete sordida]